MSVKITGLDGARNDGAREIARLRALGPSVLKVAKSAADVEKSSHRYRNRTGRLEGLTGAEKFEATDGFEVHLHQGAFYGAFVQARGFSEFEMLADEAEAMIDDLVIGE